MTESKAIHENRVEILYISTNEAAARYAISKSTVRRLFDDPEFPDIMRVGNKICIPLKAYDSYMRKYVEK